jgi:Tfp pilus assembly protein PilF
MHRTRSLVSLVVATALVILDTGCGAGGHRDPKKDPQVEAANKVRQAQSYVAAGRHGEALALLGEAEALQPGNAGIPNYQGQILFLAGRHREAEAALRKALQLDPYLADAHNNLGALYDRTGRKDEAEAEFRTALAQPGYPTPEKVHLNLGLLYGSQGRSQEALTELRHAVEIAPKYYQAHFELASLLDSMGKLEEAARLYEVAAPEYRARGDYHYRVGFVYFRLGDRVKSAEHLRRAIDVSPGSESAAKSDELLKMLR